MRTLETKTQIAQTLMEGFALRTGITKGESGDPYRRYLWTDAFAVHSFFGLYQLTQEQKYQDYALKLIEEVHNKLGRFHPEDRRQGWISGLSEEEAKMHPTINGLRIGKSLRERRLDEPFDQQLEWERDGQYFHYNTRWIQALFQARQFTDEEQYDEWAAELCLAGDKFIDKTRKQNVRMYWKMSVDLSRPLVPSMGAHDPLEGLITLYTANERRPEMFEDRKDLFTNFNIMCQTNDWSTTDPLGLGGLLLNIIRAAELQRKRELPESVKPEALLQNVNDGLDMYMRNYQSDSPAFARLAFRECGLSLGLRTVWSHKETLENWGYNIEPLRKYMHVADEIEDFWSNPENQAADTWTSHLDINEVSLASSIIAASSVESFGMLEHH